MIDASAQELEGNIATDLELGLLPELGRTERLTDAGLRALPAVDIAPCRRW